MDQLNKEEEEKLAENARELKRLQKRLREEEWRMLRGEDGEDVGKSGPARSGFQPPGGHMGQKFNATNKQSLSSGGGRSQVTGGMIPLSEGSESSHDGGSNSSEAISVGKSEGSDQAISVSGDEGSEEILEQSSEGSDGGDVGMGGADGRGGGNDHNF